MNNEIKEKLETALIRHDARVNKNNYYAIGHYLKALDEVEREVDSGTSLARALYNNFNDRVLSVCEKAMGLPLTHGSGGQDKGRPD